MKLKNVKSVKPLQKGVLVDVHSVSKVVDGIFTGESEFNPTDIKMYFGTVEKVGPGSTEKDACPGLKEGDIGFFSEFSGYHIATDEKSMKKLIPAYDIMAIVKNTKELNKDTITPTSDRVLVEVKFLDQDEGGVILSDADAKDPKLKDLDYGTVITNGPSTKGLVKENQVVAYDPYSGEIIRKAAGISVPELRLIREDDILFIIE